MATLSVVVGTLGRATLPATLQSISSQRMDGDETIVVSADPVVAVLAAEHGCRFIRIAKPGGDWGDTERQIGMEHATKDYVCFLDDDDVHLPGARQAIEDAIAANPSKPLMFRMRFGDSDYVLFLDPEIRLGNVGTPMLVLPNDKTKLGKWGLRTDRGGDYDFMRSLKWADSEIVWVRHILAQVAPERLEVPAIGYDSRGTAAPKRESKPTSLPKFRGTWDQAVGPCQRDKAEQLCEQ